jgi:hypothetical protein
LTVTDNATGSPQKISLSGTGVATATVTLSPATLNFGSVAVNGYSSWQAFTVTNNGSSSVSLSSAQVNVGSAQFDMGSYCGSTLSAGSNCTIWVMFAPTSSGTISGKLTITAAGAVLNSQLTGTGTSSPSGPNEEGKPPIPAQMAQVRTVSGESQ